jgi:hypothetical protein
MGIDQSGEYDARPVIVDINACRGFSHSGYAT